jgi:hypothetical protein
MTIVTSRVIGRNVASVRSLIIIFFTVISLPFLAISTVIRLILSRAMILRLKVSVVITGQGREVRWRRVAELRRERCNGLLNNNRAVIPYKIIKTGINMKQINYLIKVRGEIVFYVVFKQKKTAHCVKWLVKIVIKRIRKQIETFPGRFLFPCLWLPSTC